MGTTSDKLTYLNVTKQAIKNSLNLGGANITNETFREYSDTLKDLYIYYMNNGLDVVWDNWAKVTGSETTLTLNNTLHAPMRIQLKGNTYQATSILPSPDYPQDIQVVSGNNTVTIANEDNTQSASYPINLPEGMELCKIEDYQDRIAKSSGKNLIPTQASAWEQGTIAGATGQNSSSTTRIRTIDYYPIANDTNYYISVQNTNYCFLNIHLYDTSKTYLGNMITLDNSVDGKTSAQINIPSLQMPNVAYMRVVTKNKNNSTTILASEVEAIKPMIELGTTATNFEPYLEKGKWYLEKKIDKVVLNGSETWNKSNIPGAVNTQRFRAYIATNVISNVAISDKFINSSEDMTAGDYECVLVVNKNAFYISINISRLSENTIEAFTTWLSTHNTIVYYALTNATEIEITDATLIEQLETLEQAKSYNTQTNISQTNNDLGFIINATALKGE